MAVASGHLTKSNMDDPQKLMTIRFARSPRRTAPGHSASDRLLQVRDGGMNRTRAARFLKIVRTGIKRCNHMSLNMIGEAASSCKPSGTRNRLYILGKWRAQKAGANSAERLSSQ